MRIPRPFFEDHCNRDLPRPRVIRKTKSHVYIQADDPEIPELLSDAHHYATGGFGFEFAGLASSARATTRAIEAGILAAVDAGDIDEISTRTLTYTDLGEARDWSEIGWLISDCGCLRRVNL